VLRWRDVDGVWTANEKMLHVSGEGGDDRWQQLMLVFTVPEEAGQAVRYYGRGGDSHLR
jgi:hypothetical protein